MMKRFLAILCTLSMLLSVPVAATEEEVIATFNGKDYTDWQVLMQEYDFTYGTLTLMADIQDLVVTGMMGIDLNGHDIHNVTVAKDGYLYCVDSQTDDYTVADGVYGELTGTINGEVSTASNYFVLEQDSGISFHRFEMGIYGMSLRPSVAGIYYNSYFATDEAVAEQIERYGVALSVTDFPTEENIETDCVCSYVTGFEAGSSGNIANTTLLKNIMKTSNGQATNTSNSQMPIFGSPYVKIAGQYIVGSTEVRTLKEMVETADSRWDTLDAEQQAGLAAMYETYATEMQTWDAPNAKGEEPQQPGGGEQPGGSGGSDGDITITIGVQMKATVEDYDYNALTAWLEEQTGCNIDFYFYYSSISNELNTQVNYGERLPDILWNANLNDSQISQFGRYGYFKDLTPYFKDKTGASKTFWNRISSELNADQQANTLAKVTDPNNGKIYAVPTVDASPQTVMDYQIWINQTWLDALGLDMPTNAAELYEVLVAFKERDPNGNQKKDEIPLMGAQRALGAHVLDWVVNMFVCMDTQNYLNVDSRGKVYAPFTTESYRQALIYAKRLYDNGLLQSFSFNAGSTDLKTLIGADICGVVVANPLLHFASGTNVLYNYAAVPNWGYSVMNTSYKANNFITMDCKNPDKAFEVLMQLWSKEGAVRMRYGEENVNWVNADPNSLTATGGSAVIKLLSDPLNQINSAIWGAVAGTLMTFADGEIVQAPNDADAWTAYRDQMAGKAWEYYKKAAQMNEADLSPILRYTEDEECAYENAWSQCKTYVQRMMTEFVQYRDPANDAQWADYLATLESYGLQDWLNVAQTAYDRQK